MMSEDRTAQARQQLDALEAAERVRLSECYKLPYDMLGQRIRSARLEAYAEVRGILDVLTSVSAAKDENERLVFERLSLLLTGGNAATWDHVFDAAERVAAKDEEIAKLKTVAREYLNAEADMEQLLIVSPEDRGGRLPRLEQRVDAARAALAKLSESR